MNEFSRRCTTALVGGVIFFGAYVGAPFLFVGLLWMITGAIVVAEWLPLARKIDHKLLLVTPLYPVLPFMLLVLLYEQYIFHNPLIPLYPFLISWMADSMAYIVGVRWGRHKMCPSISPGKSWEGFAGACVGVLIVNYVAIPTMPIAFMVFYALLFATLAFFGDVFVSYLKRRAGVKDTGDLLPGHGGLLDRFDSVLFVVVGFVIAMRFM